MLPFSKSEDDPENDENDTLRMARAVTDHLPGGLTFDDMCPLSGDAQGLVQQLMHPDQQMRLDMESLKKQCAVEPDVDSQRPQCVCLPARVVRDTAPSVCARSLADLTFSG